MKIAEDGWIGMQHKPLATEALFQERDEAMKAIFEGIMMASASIRAVWGRFKDSAVVELVIKGV